jgi:hypothetical protein
MSIGCLPNITDDNISTGYTARCVEDPTAPSANWTVSGSCTRECLGATKLVLSSLTGLHASDVPLSISGVAKPPSRLPSSRSLHLPYRRADCT